MKTQAPRFRDNPGFALIVTLSLMILLVVIAVGLLSLATVSLRSSGNTSATRTAQANARLAMMIAIGELQKHAGPDQRVTATSGLIDNSSQKHWTGVWSTESEDSKPVWLVSGNDQKAVNDIRTLQSYPSGYFEPTATLSGNNGYLMKRKNPADPGSDSEVRVPQVDLLGKDNTKIGRYAWWVSDEGTKARVDINGNVGLPHAAGERESRAMVSQEPNFSPVNPILEPLSDPNSEIYSKKDTVVSLATTALAVNDPMVVDQYAHDLTTGGYGLPVNVVKGGMKTDLSVLFDSSMESNNTVQNSYFGGRGTSKQVLDSKFYDFGTVSDANKFYFIPELTNGGAKRVGPNWGILYNYGRLWKQNQKNGVPLQSMQPVLHANIRNNKWAPYTENDNGAYTRDVQHTNSQVSGVLSMLQVSLYLKTSDAMVPIPDSNPPVMGHQVQLLIKPLMGVWNPYNIKIQPKAYSMNFALYPKIRFAAERTVAVPGLPSAKPIRSDVYMRLLWPDTTGKEIQSADGLGGKSFEIRTPGIDLEPGEHRLFSVTGAPQLGMTNQLAPGWNEGSYFQFDIVHKAAFYPPDELPYVLADKPFVVPSSWNVWTANVELNDMSTKKGREFFSGKVEPNTTNSWIWFRSGSQHSIHRIGNIWPTPLDVTSDTKSPFAVPEGIIYNNSKPAIKYPASFLAATPVHIGTWRYFSRTTQDAVPSKGGAGSQQLRNWVDSNPRYGAASPIWDGSKLETSSEGLNAISPMLGATSSTPSFDNGPGGRGKVSEGMGGEVEATPEVDFSDNRYRGFSGNSISTDGETHVPLFDVPRAPLISIGQFQHANLARYSYEPALPFGNSYPNIRIPLDQTKVEDYAAISGFSMTDLSYNANKALWDGYFFSTIGADYKSTSGGAIDNLFPTEKLASGEIKLTNTRYKYLPQSPDETISSLINRSDNKGPSVISSRIAVEGAFNVNSTSVAAWKAILSSMKNLEFPVLSQDGTNTTWENSDEIRFPRFGHVMQSNGHQGGNPEGAEFWRGFRSINQSQLDDLAKKIVIEIKNRSKNAGPFRSFARFVNRNPDDTEVSHQQKGALQAAIDQSINNDIGSQAEEPKGSGFASDVIDGESQAAGSAGYLMQSDVLQALAPILHVRSDHFKIRTMGQALDKSGKVIATARCEAVVQRAANYLKSDDEPHVEFVNLTSQQNKNFGRKFQIVSFRWLTDQEN